MDEIEQTNSVADEVRTLDKEILDFAYADPLWTDLHIKSDEEAMAFGPEGWKEAGDIICTSADSIHRFLGLVDSDWEQAFNAKHAVRRSITFNSWRLRVTAALALAGNKIVISIRRQPVSPISISEAGLPPEATLMAEAPYGLVLVSGPTGAGKTTTLGALLDRINDQKSLHVITVEDPIEYVHVKKKSHFTLREVGVDANSFAEGLSDAMRQKPEVIMIGEIRDEDTAETALQAADSGHLVLASLHANSVPMTIRKILSLIPSSRRDAAVETLANTLVGVINQRRLPHKNMKGYVIAAEFMLNKKKAWTSDIGNSKAFEEKFNRRGDPQSGHMRMIDALVELVKSDQIKAVDAYRVFGESSELRDLLKD